MNDLVKVNTAIISTYDKAGLKFFASELVKVNPNITIISSSGTFSEIKKVAPGNPEMPGGLVKTLHPKIHGGLLGGDEQQLFMEKNGIQKIDLVVVNLYPFSKVTAEKDCTIEKARQNIDIGGVSLIEAGCKNFLRVAVISDPSGYGKVLDVLKSNNGSIDFSTRIELSKKGFSYLSKYLKDISDFFGKNVVIIGVMQRTNGTIDMAHLIPLNSEELN